MDGRFGPAESLFVVILRFGFLQSRACIERPLARQENERRSALPFRLDLLGRRFRRVERDGVRRAQLHRGASLGAPAVFAPCWLKSLYHPPGAPRRKGPTAWLVAVTLRVSRVLTRPAASIGGHHSLWLAAGQVWGA